MRRLAAGAAVLLVVGLAACGSSSGGSTTGAAGAGGPGGGRGFGFAQDPKVVACLKKQGVTLPTRPTGGQRPGAGAPPAGANGTGRRPGFRGGAQFQKLQAALKACGISFTPRGGRGAPGAPGTPSAPGTGTGPGTTPSAPTAPSTGTGTGGTT